MANTNHICTIDGCGNLEKRKGLCNAHLLRLQRHGSPHGGGSRRQSRDGTCDVSGCDARVYGRRMCVRHYQKWFRHGDPLWERSLINGGSCSVDGCSDTARTKGLCSAHYRRLWRHGDPQSGCASKGGPLAWMLAHVSHRGAECLHWPYGKLKSGYPALRYEGRTITASRLMCMLVHGQPPTRRHQAAHSCGNGHGGCVNPTHLSWKTPLENHADKVVHGTTLRGEKSPNVKLSRDQVREIERLVGTMSDRQIGARFGVSGGTVRRIRIGEHWAAQ